MRKIKFISILLVLSMLLTVPVFAFSTGFPERNSIRQILTEREDHGQPVGDDALPRV